MLKRRLVKKKDLIRKHKGISSLYDERIEQNEQLSHTIILE